MAKTTQEAVHDGEETISLAAALSVPTNYKRFSFIVVGDTPLITHAWSEKARREMLGKQIGITKPGKEARDPQADFLNSLYSMGADEEGVFGFPAMGLKKCMLSAAHKDKGLARTSARQGLWLDAEMVRTRPALAGAICDMPLIRIHGSKPEMREDMVRVGSGLNKTSTLAYRAQFTTWAFRVTGRYNSTIFKPASLAFLVREAGESSGLGEWRIEKDGMFGAFHLADVAEEKAWNDFIDNGGPLPVSDNAYSQAAA
jgi:hypothetical protein